MPTNYIHIMQDSELFHSSSFANNSDGFYLMLGKFVNLISMRSNTSIDEVLANINHFALQAKKEEEKSK